MLELATKRNMRRSDGGAAPIPSKLPDSSDARPPSRSFEEERLYRKQRLAISFRLFARMGFGVGASGHISARDPELTDHFWVNPLAMHFSKVRVSDLVLVSEEGKVADGGARVNPAAVAIHAQLHTARPDVVSIAHTHSLYGKTFSSMGKMLEPLCQDSAAFYGDLAIFNEYTGIVNDMSEGRMIAEALTTKNSVLLVNHGILTVGASVESAVWRYVSLENACHVQLLAQQAGGGTPMSHEIAAKTNRMSGSDLAGCYSFEPYWTMLTAEEPDALD